MREPAFWWRQRRGTGTTLLAPLASLYGAVAARRLVRPGRGIGAPVVCIGNPTVGGSGKTPLVMAVARMFLAAGRRPVLLTRGYGGSLRGPVQVDPERHGASEVGDEPLLLARVTTTIVARDRVRGAEAALAAGARVIVMDDGFQNPSLAKSASVLVVDGRRGIGNGRVFPAGPLRAPLGVQMARADALVVARAGYGADGAIAEALARRIPVFHAAIEPDAGFIATLAGSRALAFAGIGDPEKFFATLRDAGVDVAEVRSFPDHHRYTTHEATRLCSAADRAGLVLVTTEKDLARLQGDAGTRELAARAHALPVRLLLDDEMAFRALLLARIAAPHREEPWAMQGA